MAKTSKTVPQKEEAPSSSCSSKSKEVVPPSVEEYVPGPFDTSSDLKIEKPSSVPGLEEVVLIRPPPPSEEETQKPSKDRKRKKEMLAESPKLKRAKARKPRADATVLTLAAAESLRVEDEDDDDCTLGEDDAFGDFFADFEEDDDLDAPIILEEAAKLQKQVMMLYDRAFYKLRAELTHSEEEFKKLSAELKELKTLYAQREEELNSLRASLEKVLQERANFIEQEEITAKDAEILELKRCKDSMDLERDTLRGELASTQGLLHGSKEEAHKFQALYVESAAALSMAKSEVDALLSSYQDDVAAANARAREISEEAEIKLARALAHARLDARRKAFEKAYAKGFDLSAEIEEVRALEEKSAAPTTSDEGSASGSGSSEELWLPCPNPFTRKREVPPLLPARPMVHRWHLAFDKLKSELLHCEAKMRKALNGEKSLRLLCDKKIRELTHLRSELDQSRDYEGILEKQMKAKVVDARAEAKEVRAKADKKVAIYLKDVTEARTKFRGASDRERRSNEYT
ncbi:uncharacterized protein [Nicotiana sylvestris]|uniref:uncharacterized protein n=1 Tax=Nicotiana sylvestris TaxID=4096 RepID=UPI00388CDE93